MEGIIIDPSIDLQEGILPCCCAIKKIAKAVLKTSGLFWKNTKFSKLFQIPPNSYRKRGWDLEYGLMATNPHKQVRSVYYGKGANGKLDDR